MRRRPAAQRGVHSATSLGAKPSASRASTEARGTARSWPRASVAIAKGQPKGTNLLRVVFRTRACGMDTSVVTRHHYAGTGGSGGEPAPGPRAEAQEAAMWTRAE